MRQRLLFEGGLSDEDALFVNKEQWQELKKILTVQNKKED